MPSTLIHSLPNSGLSREKPGPKPRSMVKLGLNNGRSISPTPSSPKISTYSRRDGAWRRYCQVRRRSKWISLRSRLFKSQHQGLIFVGSSQLAVYFLHAFVYKMLSCRPGHRGPASRAGSTVPKKVAPANPSSTWIQTAILHFSSTLTLLLHKVGHSRFPIKYQKGLKVLI